MAAQLAPQQRCGYQASHRERALRPSAVQHRRVSERSCDAPLRSGFDVCISG